MLAFLACRAEGDFVHIHISWLADGEGHCAGERLRGDGEVLVELADGAGDIRLRNALWQLGRDRARGNDGRAEVVRLHFLAQAFRNHQHCALGGCINGATRANLAARDGGDVDDVAALLSLHVRKCSRDAVEDALDVDVDGLIPVGDFQAFQRGVGHQAGVVNHDVNAAKRFHRLVDQCLYCVSVRYIGSNGNRLATIGRDVFCNLVNSLNTARTQRDDGALCCQVAGGCFAQAAACAGDNDDFAFNIVALLHVHLNVPFKVLTGADGSSIDCCVDFNYGVKYARADEGNASMKVGLSELTAFTAIAEHKSFRTAALRLGVSPSALSHALRGMEERLNVRLFNRTTRSVALTEAGEQLLRRVAPAMADLADAMDEVASAVNRPSGTIRISAAEAGARPLIRHVLPDFLEKYPDVHIEFVVDTRFVDIVADGYDAGIRVFDDVPKDMIAVKFGADIKFTAVASPAYLAKYGTPDMPEDLLKHRCIRFRFSSGTLYRWNLERRGKSVNIDATGPMTLGNTNLMLDAALEDIGIAWLPEYQTAAHVASGSLVPLLQKWSPTMPGLCFYYPANGHPPTALRLFTQAIKDWERERT